MPHFLFWKTESLALKKKKKKTNCILFLKIGLLIHHIIIKLIRMLLFSNSLMRSSTWQGNCETKKYCHLLKDGETLMTNDSIQLHFG